MIVYQWFGSGVVAESGASGLDVGRKLGFIEWCFGRSHIFFGDDVVDRLFHLLIFLFIISVRTPSLSSLILHSKVPLKTIIYSI